MSGLLSDFARKNRNEIWLFLAVLAVLAITSVIDDSYRVKPAYNAHEILRQASMLGIFALGAAVVIISGGIDLSSGAVIAMSSTVCASIIFTLAPRNENGVPITSDLSLTVLAAAVVGTLFVAFLIGSFHAWLITSIRLPPFVATLASLVGLRSLARVLVQDVSGAVSTQGSSTKIYVEDELFHRLGSDWWIPLAVFLLISFGLWLLLSRTVVGRHLYAMGGNEEAARLSGIRTERLKWLAYCIGTMTAAVAGILYTAEVATANPTSLAMGYELNAIAAAVVGGCSLAGGVGTVGGTMLGALFLRVIIDAVAKTVKAGADDYEGLIVGMLVVLAVALNELRDEGWLRKRFFPGPLGVLNIGILSLVAGVIAAVMAAGNKATVGLSAFAGVLVVLCIKKWTEVVSGR